MLSLGLAQKRIRKRGLQIIKLRYFIRIFKICAVWFEIIETQSDIDDNVFVLDFILEVTGELIRFCVVEISIDRCWIGN